MPVSHKLELLLESCLVTMDTFISTSPCNWAQYFWHGYGRVRSPRGVNLGIRDVYVNSSIAEVKT